MNLENEFRKLKIKQLDLLERMKKLEKRLNENSDEAEECDKDLEDLSEIYNKITVEHENQVKKMID